MSKYISIRSGATALTEKQVTHLDFDVINNTGVVDALSDHWYVSEHNPTGLSVDVAEGYGYFAKTTIVYHGYTDAVENLVISANSSGNPRVDSVVIYVDLGASPDATASNVLKFKVVEGTPAGSPSAPDDTAVQSSVGAGNPFLRLANITVSNGATQILNTDISDARVPVMFKLLMGILLGERNTPTSIPANTLGMIAKLRSSRHVPVIVDENLVEKEVITEETFIADSDASTITFDRGLGRKHKVTLGGNRTLAISNMNTGESIQIWLKQDATGNRTVTWWSGISWQDNNTVPTLTPTANKTDVFVIIKTGTGAYTGFVAGQES